MDTAKFKDMIMPHYQKLYRIAFAVVGETEDAEDIVQEVFCKLWKKRDMLDKLDSCEAYCVSVTKNISIDFVRSSGFRNRQATTREMPTIKSGESNPEAILQAQSEVAAIRALIEKLPEKQQLILRLRGENELSVEEVEQITGFTSADIRTTLSRARQTLKQEYEKLYGNGK